MVFRTDGFASHAAAFLRVFCVSAEAAAAFASLLAVLLRRTFEAVAATFALVVSLLPFCVRADAATDFSSFDAVLLLRTLAAAEATLELVLSDLAALAMGVCSLVAICELQILQREKIRGEGKGGCRLFQHGKLLVCLQIRLTSLDCLSERTVWNHGARFDSSGRFV